MKNPLVEILLATYNGEKYISHQLDSILNQTYKNIRILIHDDGSTDNTLKIIKEYQNEYPDRIFLIDDGIKTGGAVWNFEHLMKYSNAEYIMFSDQDDVWLPEKIEITLHEFIKTEEKNKNTPILVYTDAIVVDDELKILNESFWKYTKIRGDKISLGRALETSLGLGCTMMFNRSLRNLSIPFPKSAIAHDMWVSLVAVSLGIVRYINKSTILYRQHRTNVSGAEKSNTLILLKNLFSKEKMIKFRENYYKKRDQAKDFLNIFSEKLPINAKNIIKEYVELDKQKPLIRIFKILKNDILWTGNIRDFARLITRWIYL